LLGKLSWRYLFLSMGIILLPTIPLMLSGSNFDVVAQICLAGIGILPLAFSQKPKKDYGLRVFAVLIAVGLSISNLTSIAKLVNESNIKDRLQVESLITKLIEKYPTNKPLHLSGFIFTEVDGPDAIVSIARLEMGYPLYHGAVRSHPHQFGLSSKAVNFTEEELEHAASCGLQRAYDAGDFIILVEPARVDEKQVKEWSARGQGNIFSNQMAARMDRIALASGRLVDTGIAGMLGTIPVRFYSIKPGKSVPFDNCP